MAGDKTYFAPSPPRAMRPLTYFNKGRQRDEELTALDLRLLMCVGWHDRLSKSKGSSGCYASNALMAAECGCTITSVSRSISHLVSAGLIERDHGGVPGKRHLTVYRVLYDNADKEMLAQLGNDHLPNVTNDEDKSFVRSEEQDPKTLVQGHQENDAISDTSFSQEISLSEGIGSAYADPNSAEAGKLNSAEAARLAAGDEILGINYDLEHEANIARLDRALKCGQTVDRARWYAYLEVIEDIRDDHFRNRVVRVSEALAETMTAQEMDEALNLASKALAALADHRSRLSNVIPFSAASSDDRNRK